MFKFYKNLNLFGRKKIDSRTIETPNTDKKNKEEQGIFNYKSSFDETDKFRSDHKWCPGHNYRLVYPYFLMTKPKRILEIGTASGGFAKFLRDNNIGEYIVGADTSKPFISNHIPSNETWENLFDDFYVGDATKEDFLDWIDSKGYKFDLIIEDGDHTLEMQTNLMRKCHRLLSDNGVYITEDIESSFVATRVLRSVPDIYKKYSYCLDLRYSNGRKDDLIVVVDLRKL